MPRRLAFAALLAAVLAAGLVRRALETPRAPRDCPVEGRGTPPRHWLGCWTDPGPARALAPDERLMLGLPLDPNVADARSLSFVPGLSRRLAAEVVADRQANGPYVDTDDLLRVRGIGPKRLARARPHLAVDP
jgi:competence protein ComEA